jgi:hypothetical protein
MFNSSAVKAAKQPANCQKKLHDEIDAPNYSRQWQQVVTA